MVGTLINNQLADHGGDKNNFAARYTYGNRRTGIKIAHWNKGGGYLTNKINEVEYLVRYYKPHVIGISESNWSSGVRALPLAAGTNEGGHYF